MAKGQHPVSGGARSDPRLELHKVAGFFGISSEGRELHLDMEMWVLESRTLLFQKILSPKMPQ